MQFIENADHVTDQWVKTALKDKVVDEDAEVADAPPIADEPGGEHHDPLEYLPSRSILPQTLDRDLIEWKRCKVTLGLKQIKIYFDHFTSDSNRQRGYGNCLKHENCFRWKMCHNFGSKREYAAYIWAWAVAGERCSDRTEHMNAFEPSEEDVKHALDHVEVQDF